MENTGCGKYVFENHVTVHHLHQSPLTTPHTPQHPLIQEPEHRQQLERNIHLVEKHLGVAVQSPIIPLVVGDNGATLGAARHLLQVSGGGFCGFKACLLHCTTVVMMMSNVRQPCSHTTQCGYHVPAIRPPTVPVGTSRLRLSLSAAHTEADIEGLGNAIRSSGVHYQGIPASRL